MLNTTISVYIRLLENGRDFDEDLSELVRQFIHPLLQHIIIVICLYQMRILLVIAQRVPHALHGHFRSVINLLVSLILEPHVPLPLKQECFRQFESFDYFWRADSAFTTQLLSHVTVEVEPWPTAD